MFSLLAETDNIVVPAAETTGGLQGFDYLVVVIYLLGVLAVGVYFSRQQTRSEDYFVGGRQMPWFAVGLSIMASLLSTISYLASPGEMIKNGPTMALAWLVVPFVFVVVSFVWLPFLMKLKLTSVYEYLDRRFGSSCRANWPASCLSSCCDCSGWGLVVLTAIGVAVADITYASMRPGWLASDFGLQAMDPGRAGHRSARFGHALHGPGRHQGGDLDRRGADGDPDRRRHPDAGDHRLGTPAPDRSTGGTR